MAEIFRSALNYISQTGKSGNDFVGQYVELGPVQLRVRRVIAEGNLVVLSVRWTLVPSLSFVQEYNARFKTANLIYSTCAMSTFDLTCVLLQEGTGLFSLLRTRRPEKNMPLR